MDTVQTILDVDTPDPKPSQCEYGPRCKECHDPVRWPRNIAFYNEVHPPLHIRPSSQSTLVVHARTIPEKKKQFGEPVIPFETFREISLTYEPRSWWKGSHRLVEDFAYSIETGEVLYLDEPDFDDALHEYARLMTLPSWYKILLKCFCSFALTFMDHYANILLIFGMFVDDGESSNLWNDFPYSRYAYGVSWILMMTIAFSCSVYYSWIEWSVSICPSVGDMPVLISWRDKLHSFCALVCFNFFSVDDTVKKAVILLHPWKNHQPYAAVKVDGTRATILGYADKDIHVVMNRSGQFSSTMVLTGARSLVFVFKCYVASCILLGIAGTNASPYAISFSCLSSFPSLVIGWYLVFELLFARCRLKTQLLRTAKECEKRCGMKRCVAEECLNCTELHRRRWDSAKMTLVQEYGYSVKDFPPSVKSNKSDASAACKRCGKNGIPLIKTPGEKTAQVGDLVVLSKYHSVAHDAKFGPLMENDVGEVQRVVPSGKAGTHARCRVVKERYNDGTKKFERTFEMCAGNVSDEYWYDERALRVVAPEEVEHLKKVHSAASRPSTALSIATESPKRFTSNAVSTGTAAQTQAILEESVALCRDARRTIGICQAAWRDKELPHLARLPTLALLGSSGSRASPVSSVSWNGNGTSELRRIASATPEVEVEVSTHPISQPFMPGRVSSDIFDYSVATELPLMGSTAS